MAMYLFASRLTLAVTSLKKSKKSARHKNQQVHNTHTSNMCPNTSDNEFISMEGLSPSPSQELKTFAALVERVRADNGDCDIVEQFQRNQVTRKSLGPCDRSHRCDNRPTKHRVRFSNTFPRINRKKKISDLHEEGEIVLQNEYEIDQPDNRLEKDLIFRDNNLVSGSLEALIERLLTSPDNTDRAFTFAFLLSSRLFLSPSQLLGQLIFLANSAPGCQDRTGSDSSRLVHLLAEWMEMFPYDFKEDRMMSHVKGIIQRSSGVEALSSVLQNLLKRLTSLDVYHQYLQSIQNCKIDNKRDILTSKPDDLAQQLAVIELERFSHIGPEEFLQAFSQENAKNKCPPKNLQMCITWANRLTYLVATMVVQQKKMNKRVKMVELWIETGELCLKMNNFNSLISIVSGLNLPSVTRLRSTWAKLDRRKFVALEQLLDTSGDFANYRNALRAVSRKLTSASGDQHLPQIIPYFSLFLKDVFAIQEECCTRLRNGHISFEKFWQMAKLVTEFITWQQGTSQMVKDDSLSLYLQCYQPLAETDLLRASFQCEAPSTLVEREQCKTLKST